MPNPDMSAVTWFDSGQNHLGTYGNSYSWIQRTIRGNIVNLWLRSPKPERTEPFRSPKDGKIYYQVRDDRGREEEPIPAADMLHVPYFSMDGILENRPSSS